jgi:uncharacterized protein (UPF0335 family)
MYKIIDGKVVKIETIESIIEVSSDAIISQLKDIDNTIESLKNSKATLEKDLEEVYNLEKKVKI